MHNMRCLYVVGLFVTFFKFSIARSEDVTISCGGAGQEFALCKSGVEAWEKKTGHKVKVLPAASNTTERLALYQQLLAAKSADIDIFTVDVIWPGILGSHFEDLKPHLDAKQVESHFPAMIQNNTVGGRLLSIPWYTDAGLLYYRKDLLTKYKVDVPKTWEELGAAAKKIQTAERAAGQTKLWGFVFQGRAYEGLTCNALEWIHSFGGGQFVDEKGAVTIANDNAAKALKTMSSWMGDIIPEGTLSYSEEESRGVFQAGQAVFLRNWPYVWNLANEKSSPIAGKVGVTVLPHSGSGVSTATLGGWGLSISKYSKHKPTAASLVAYLTSVDEQRRRAVEGAYNPTHPVLYKDAAVLKANPFMGELFGTFTSAIGRPSRITGSQYNRVSSEIWNTMHSVLSKKREAKVALDDLEKKLKRIGRNGKW